MSLAEYLFGTDARLKSEPVWGPAPLLIKISSRWILKLFDIDWPVVVLAFAGVLPHDFSKALSSGPFF